MTTSNFHQRLKAIHQKNRENMPTHVVDTFLQTEHILARSNILEQSIQLGQNAPNFHFKSKWCAQTTLSELLKTGPVIVSFYRGFWCSSCREEMQEYLRLMPQFERLGNALTDAQQIHYLAINPQQIIDQPVDLNEYHYISDPNLEIAKQFGIAYEQPIDEQRVFSEMGFSVSTVNKTSKAELPLPALFVIDQQGKVIFRKVSLDYRDRQDPNELFDVF